METGSTCREVLERSNVSSSTAMTIPADNWEDRAEVEEKAVMARLRIAKVVEPTLAIPAKDVPTFACT